MLAPTRKSLFPVDTVRPALVAVMILVVSTAFADPPAGYYDSVDLTNAETLRATVHNIIDDHIRIPYTATSTDTWNVLELADQDPNDSSRIIDVYKNRTYPKYGAGNNDYNREHTWPKSYGFPDESSTNKPYSDCHMLMLCDGSYNTSRSNNYFDDCFSGCSTYPADNYNGESGVNRRNSDLWETWIGRRGDVARAQFYADVRYSGDLSNEPDLILTDDTNLIVVYSSNAAVAHMGILQTLIQWHYEDPVDDRERNRNDVVFSFQNNRNPFIDHPEYVSYIFENALSAVDDVIAVRGPAATIESIYPNPFNPQTTIDFSLVRSGPVRVEIYSVDGRLVRTLLSDDRQVGNHQVRWDGTGNTGGRVPSGAYFCRVLGAGSGESDTRPLLLLK